jgi:hypothetical protein
MSIKKDNVNPAGDALPSATPSRMDEAFQQVVDALPELEAARVAELVQTIKDFPASGKRTVIGKLAAGSAAEKALAYYVLLEYGTRIVDDLNALVFDGGRSAEVKVRADELLSELGSPIDRDVMESSVPDPDAIRAKSPWQALREWQQGHADGALKRLQALDGKARAVLLHRMAIKDVISAVPLFEKLASVDEDAAIAVISALDQRPAEQALPLLRNLCEADSRAVQKLARKALHDMGLSGMTAPEGEAVVAEETVAEEKDTLPRPAKEDTGALPLHKALVAQPGNGRYAYVAVAREYPNGRLQVFVAMLDFYKRGVRGVRYWVDMSKSRFRRLMDEVMTDPSKPHEATVEECLRLVGRGIRVAREVGTPIPFDIQAGKHMLGDIEAEAGKAIPFPCAGCGQPLPNDMIARIKQAAAYEQIAVEILCDRCREAARKAG